MGHPNNPPWTREVDKNPGPLNYYSKARERKKPMNDKERSMGHKDGRKKKDKRKSHGLTNSSFLYVCVCLCTVPFSLSPVLQVQWQINMCFFYRLYIYGGPVHLSLKLVKNVFATDGGYFRLSLVWTPVALITRETSLLYCTFFFQALSFRFHFFLFLFFSYLSKKKY